ncbi:MAG TPA: Crp/Fnr family transcriptional regulator [Acidobacteriaceae bacterium]|nr:Crp/Fnr family transcriptional regulator [Acidobacteriaceae bacterium]
MVFKEGQSADAVYLVCDGQLKLYTTSREGRVMIVRLARPGNLLGLSAVMDRADYEISAETLMPTILRRITQPDFVEFQYKYPEVGRHTSEVLAKDYRYIFQDARRLALSGSASGRLARLLLDWSEELGNGCPELRFKMSLTHEEMASMAGTSRETVTRLLNRYERGKLIAREGSSIVILNPGQLDAFAG